MVQTVLPIKAAVEEVVVEPKNESELKNKSLWRATFKTLRFIESLYSDMNYICRRKD